MKEIKIDDAELYGTRLLCFLETEPQSNMYHQVRLNPEQFKTFSFSLGKVVDVKGDMQNVEFEMSVETYKLPDLPEIYY